MRRGKSKCFRRREGVREHMCRRVGGLVREREGERERTCGWVL